MRYLYKIWSGYDGFTPRQIPARKSSQGRLELGWRRHLDVIEPGDEVWVYFHGPHSFADGVYLKGALEEIDIGQRRAFLSVQEESTTRPLTAGVTSRRVAQAVSQRYRQVFLYPQAWGNDQRCTALATASTCGAERCELCDAWMGLPRVQAEEQRRPSRLSDRVREIVPGYWVIPSRCFLHSEPRPIRSEIRRSTELFYAFKLGSEKLAYPLALGVYEALQTRGLTTYDLVVPIPLSPDKARSKELHRTRALARRLAQFLGTPMREILSLAEPISKSRARQLGWGPARFEQKYRELMRVDDGTAIPGRILLVDDVVTKGSTLRVAAEAIADSNGDAQITAALAGQMILVESVADPSRFLLQDEDG